MHHLQPARIKHHRVPAVRHAELPKFAIAPPHPLGMHGGLWGLLVNTTVALNVSAYTTPPSTETIERVHGEVERFVYGTEE
jgi:hypothetical protein